jgi:heme exporter protein D
MLVAGLTSGAVALCVLIPFLRFGIPSGHDFEFHLNSWIEVVDHWKQGVLYPHWSALAHWGYGEARFVFYPPISWTLGAVLGLLLPWKLVPAAYIWLALTLSGISMFLLAREWLPARDAIFTAAVYAANPYYFVIVYWRSAMAELLAAAGLPLLVLLVMRFERSGARVIAPLSILLAAGWLTNIPAALMMNYSLALLLCCLFFLKRSYSLLAYGAASVVIGAALAGFYLAPVVHQQSWINLSQVLAPGVSPRESFLFTSTSDPDHDRFNRLVSVIATWQIAILAAGLYTSRRFRKQTSWILLCAWATACALLMFHFTLPLWNYFPELRYVQFPWRWLLCLNVPFAVLIAFAFQRQWRRILVCGMALASVVLVWRYIQQPWWDQAGDIQEMVENQHEGIGNEGADEYVPANIDPYDADQNAPRARFDGRGQATIDTPKWDAESRTIVAEATAPGQLVLRLFNYPAWKVQVNGATVHASTSDIAGRMMIPIPAGDSKVEIEFTEGWDRWVGVGISLIALLLCIAVHNRKTLPQHNISVA